MRTFDYFFGLRLGILLLRYSDNLSTSLQVESLCAVEAQEIVKSTVNTLKRMRSDEKFNLLWKDVENKAAIFFADHPRLPRKKRALPRIEESWEEVQHQNSMMTWCLITEKYTTSPWILSSMP